MDRVRIAKFKSGREIAYISVNGVKLDSCTNYKIEKEHNEPAKVIIELDADIEIVNCENMNFTELKEFMNRGLN